MTEPYTTTLTPSRIRSIAADRINVSKLHSQDLQTDELVVLDGITLPDGSLKIDTRGAGVHLTALPEDGDLVSPNTFYLKTLVAGTNVTFADSPDSLTINSSGGGGGGITSIASAGGAQTLIKSGVPAVATLKGLTPGAGVSLTPTTDDITIANTATVADSSASGDETLINSGTAPAYLLKRLAAGTGVTLGSTADVVTISSNSGITDIVSAGGDESLIKNGMAPVATLKALDAGVGIGLSSTTDAVTIDNTATLADSSVSGDQSLINTGTAPAYLLKRLAAGPGISLSANSDVVTIDNIGVGTTPSITSLAGDEALIPGSPQMTFTFTIKSLTAGAGISLASDANAVTITNSGVAQVYTLQTDAASVGTSLVSVPSPTANDFRLLGLSAGAGITLGIVGGDIVITNTGGGGTAMLSSAGGTSIVTAGVNPLQIQGITTTGAMRTSTTATTFGFDNRCLRIRGTDGSLPSNAGADNATASGTPSLALGDACVASATNSTAIGHMCTSAGNASLVAGNNCSATSALSVTLGNGSTNSGDDSVLIGRASTVGANRGIGIGRSVNVSAVDAIGMGFSSVASATGAQALGAQSLATANHAKAFGYGVRCGGTRATVLGYSDDNSVDLSAGVADYTVVGRHLGGFNDIYAYFGPTVCFSRRPYMEWFNQASQTSFGSDNLNVNCFFQGDFTVTGNDPNFDLTVPTAAQVRNAEPLGVKDGTYPVIRGSEFLIYNEATQNIHFRSTVGSNMRLRNFDGTISEPFDIILNAQTRYRFRWHNVSATQVLLRMVP